MWTLHSLAKPLRLLAPQQPAEGIESLLRSFYRQWYATSLILVILDHR